MRKGNKPSSDLTEQERHLSEDRDASDPENSSPKFVTFQMTGWFLDNVSGCGARYKSFAKLMIFRDHLQLNGAIYLTIFQGLRQW